MKLFFVSLGCDKNLVDSEKMLALLAEQNIEITEEPKEAEIIPPRRLMVRVEK